MSTFTVSETAAKPYVSRRKRHRRRQVIKLKEFFSTRSMLGLLGLLVLALLISLGIIATQMNPSFSEDYHAPTASL
ncbi:hypothetical protein [Hymenobacter coalescens]